MSKVSARTGQFSLTAYVGDAKTLLAFNLAKASTKNLAGFTIQCAPPGQPTYYVFNTLQFETPGDHAQDPKEPPNSSINAPIHKFRWLHVPGSVHQGTSPAFGQYTYTVTPRYFENHSLQPLDPTLSASVRIGVQPFAKAGLQLGFTRGFVQSQAFVHHYGLKALIRPDDKTLQFDTTQQSGKNAAGEPYTFQDEYAWLGFTARERIFSLLNDVLADRNLRLDVLAYDLNEPDIIAILLKLAGQGRIRVILDNAPLHHNTTNPKPEDQFEKLFKKVAKNDAAILRGHFSSFAHDKVFVVSDGAGPKKVLTGATNFAVNGLYVNSNHVLVFNDPEVAAKYAEVFEASWTGDVKQKAFASSPLANQTFAFKSKSTPPTDITFAPHEPAFASTVLSGITKRIAQEGRAGKTTGSVLFAVMQFQGNSPVYTALKTLHTKQTIFSYGISDMPGGIYLYPVDKKTGVLVTGKPARTQLPPPFDQVPGVYGVGHQIHHKFVVCGFNGPDPVVYCGSSNLTPGGENKNGDNLLEIHDGDVATGFAIEALALVDHFNFLDNYAVKKKAKGSTKKPPASLQQAALSAHWFLSTDDRWTQKYFNPKDLHSVDRQLFA